MAFSLGFALLELLLIVDVKATKWKYNEYTVEFEAGKLTFLPCHACPAGFGLFPQYGSRIKDYETKNECKPCLLGIIYCTYEDINSCDCFKPCTVCSIGPTEELPCNVENDMNEFKPCSTCCSSNGVMHVEQCAEQKMPKNVEHSYTNGGGRACAHQRSEEQKSTSSVLLAVIVDVRIIVILVTIVFTVFYGRRRFFRLKGSNLLPVSRGGKGRYEAMFEGQGSQPEKLMSFDNAGDTFVQIRVEDPSGNCKESGTCKRHWTVTEQGAFASKPLESLVHDLSESVEKICRRLDARVRGAGHYEVIANYFGFDLFDIRAMFETSVGSPSRAMIEAIVVRLPELTVEKFARVVEEKAQRKDVARLLRAYDRGWRKESV